MNVVVRDSQAPRLGDAPRWELYKLLGEPVRLRLLALVAADELTVGELSELLSESQPNASRHASQLKQAGLIAMRKQGTRALVSLSEHAAKDPVVQDALASGQALCVADGSLRRVAEIVAQREATGREFFSRPKGGAGDTSPSELLPYVAAFAALLPDRDLAVDVGTGDGLLLDVLAPAYKRVIAIDQSEPQLDRARARAEARRFSNVDFVLGSIDDDATGQNLHGRADLVFASRVLHHAARPADLVKKLARLCRAPHGSAEGGAIVVVDYAHHEDESMREQADVWLGFEARELLKFARDAGLSGARVVSLPQPSRGPDAHLGWQALVGRLGGGGAPSAGPGKIK
jgi:ArsR family transcriptional regulator